MIKVQLVFKDREVSLSIVKHLDIPVHYRSILAIKRYLTCLGVLHADASIAVKAGRAAAADVADMRRPAVDALNPREAGPTGTRS